LADGRLTIVRYIGRGGMGVVYEARDEERQCTVALKALTMPDAEGIYRLKNEFRTLADVHQANLVRLFELFSDGGLWFFTMDLIAGERFTAWARPDDTLHVERLRSALRQLLDGLAAIHAVGKLHRDIKPSNVLVTAAGRVMVLDFGLVAERQDRGLSETVSESGIVGTPLYMAPEQATGQPVTTASDVYSLGVMLFEALAGRPPFEGSGVETLLAKLNDPPPVLPDAGLPRDLRELCETMLVRDPAARPPLAEIRRRLGPGTASPRAKVREPDPAPRASELFGRAVELQALRAAFEGTLRDRAVLVSVTGESGMGKTSLCTAFLEEARGRGARVLGGRCYERERVPYKAVDSVIDRLSRTLRQLPAVEAAALLPRDAFALASLFPVLNRVDVIATAPAKSGLHPTEVQRRGFAALGELLGRLRDRGPLVVLLDDLQWMDVDSVTLLKHLFLQPAPVPALFIISHRSPHATELVERVLEAARSNHQIELRSLKLGPLALGDVQALAESPLYGAATVEPSLAIAKASRGSPFFAAELARLARYSAGAPLPSSWRCSRGSARRCRTRAVVVRRQRPSRTHPR